MVASYGAAKARRAGIGRRHFAAKVFHIAVELRHGAALRGGIVRDMARIFPSHAGADEPKVRQVDSGPSPTACSGKMRSLSLLSCLALTACGPPPLPPAPVVKPPPPVMKAPTPVVTAAATSSPVFSLVREPRVAPTCGAPPTSEPGPIRAGFHEVTLPANTPALLDVEGRDDRDVWFLPRREDKQSLLHWDGAALSEERVSCYGGKGESLVLGRDEMIVLGAYFNGEYMEFEEARHSPSRGWSCPHRDGQAVYLPLGAEMLRLAAWGQGVLSGHPLPLPDLGETESYLSWPQIAGRAPDDVWVTSGGRDVLHWNGVAWEDRSPGLSSVWNLHVAANGAVWLAGDNDDEPDGSNDGHKDKDRERPRGGRVVLRWDPVAHAWVCLPTPATLYTVRVRGMSADEVWLIGEGEIFHWDGKAFQRELTPIPHLSEAWLSPAGELWLVGWEGAEDSKSGVGLAFRTRAGGNP